MQKSQIEICDTSKFEVQCDFPFSTHLALDSYFDFLMLKRLLDPLIK